MAALIDDIAGDPSVGRGVGACQSDSRASVLLSVQLLQVDDFESITQAANRLRPQHPGDSGCSRRDDRDRHGRHTGFDSQHPPGRYGGREGQDAERRISELAAGDEGPLRVSSLSPVVIEDEYKEATEKGMAPLVGLALLLIAALLLLFTRTLSDMLLTLTGLVFSIVWVVGAEGWLGPNALGLIGPPSSLTAMVPVIIISLTVDYAIQAVSHYREQRVEGKPVVVAVRIGLQNVTVPLTLAAVTTIVSLLATLLSPIGVIGDFGIVAGLGVGMSLIVMLTLIPAGRTIIDRRRESRGTLPPALSRTHCPASPRWRSCSENGLRVGRHPTS